MKLPVRILHIGSTAFGDIAAKPIIDMLILIDNPRELRQAFDVAAALKWVRLTLKADRIFSSPTANPRRFHFHLTYRGSVFDRNTRLLMSGLGGRQQFAKSTRLSKFGWRRSPGRAPGVHGRQAVVPPPSGIPRADPAQGAPRSLLRDHRPRTPEMPEFYLDDRGTEDRAVENRGTGSAPARLKYPSPPRSGIRPVHPLRMRWRWRSSARWRRWSKSAWRMEGAAPVMGFRSRAAAPRTQGIRHRLQRRGDLRGPH